jgi:hypothetical protein
VSAAPEAVLLDPYHPYAVRLIEALHRQHALRVVAVYSDRRELRRQAHKYPVLGGPLVSASYIAGPGGLAGLAAHLREHHDVRAVVPHQEPGVLPLLELADRLGLAWAQPQVLGRFRAKGTLKEHLRRAPQPPRINATALVDDVAGVRAAVERHGLDRFVLKPDDGYGNVAVGVLEATAADSAIAEHLGRRPGQRWLLEEFLDGPELFVNGQVDAAGAVTVYSVTRYVRRDEGGRTGLALGDVSIRTDDPLFAPSAAYAASVIRASGLRRSPWHLELKVDDQGPCLIEVGARLPGGGHADYDEMLHGGALDPFAVAARHYVDESTAHVPLDWAAYDAAHLGQINGLSTGAGRVSSVHGLAVVEALPEFVRWEHRPRVGERLVATRDLLSHPWRVTVRTDDLERYGTLLRRVPALVEVRAPRRGAVGALDRAAAYRPLVSGRVSRALHHRPVVPVPVPGAVTA